LKLANVAPRFIKAYRAEEIRLDQLEALAITDDQQAQEKVWDSLRHDWERSPHNLRSLLTEKHVSASDRRARFVGVEAYVAAGGTLERDLFDEDNEGYLADPALLDQLVTDRSASVVTDLQAQGWAWAEVHLENDYWEALQKYNALRPAPVELDPALLAEADKLRAELDAIDQASDEEEPSDEAERRRDEIEIRLDEIEAGQTEFTGEQKSQAGVIVTLGHNGKPVYHCGLVERRGKGASTSGADNDSPKEEKDGVSAAVLQDLTIQRTAALRAALSVRPDIALIAITHNLAAQIFYDQTYLLPSSLTVRTDAHADGFDLRVAAESEAAKALNEQTTDVRNLLPPQTRASLGLGARTAPECSTQRPGTGRCSHRQRCPRPARRCFYWQISCRRCLSSRIVSRHGQLVASHRCELFRAHQKGPNFPSYPRSYRSSR
jgi:ParB family chromosome partitioning protein